MRNIKSNNFKILTFCLIIIQSVGIRFFNGQGTLLSIIIIVISFKNFKKFTIKDVRFLFIAFMLILISKLINESFTFSILLYQLSLIIATYLFLVSYRRRMSNLQNDFFLALQIFVFHAVVGYLLYLMMPNQFIETKGLNKSFYDLFYVSNSTFGNVQRNTGFFWEPGVFQLIANFYLFYCIKFNKNIIKILFAIFAVVSSLSTTGLFILLINATYFIYTKWKEKKIKLINIILIMSVLIITIPIINNNAKDKISDDNTSGLVRLRDYYIGFELIKERPILGHGIFDSEYLSSKNYVLTLESNLFSNEYLEISGDMGGGYTNGFLGLIAWYGIPVSFLLYFFYFKNKFIDNNLIERILFNLIPIITLFSEPISYTSLFLMFPFSYWILSSKKISKRISRNFVSGNSLTKKQLISSHNLINHSYL